MTDLISRQAAIDAINKALDSETLLNRFVRKVVVDAVKVLPPVHEQTTIDPVKHGKWKETGDKGGRNYACDCCRFTFIMGTCMGEPMWNYCPNCGAKMERNKE